MSTMSRITALASKARPLTDSALPSPRKIYEYAVAGRFPAHQVNGIWHFRDEDMQTILAAFGLRPKGQQQSRQHSAEQAAA